MTDPIQSAYEAAVADIFGAALNHLLTGDGDRESSPEKREQVALERIRRGLNLARRTAELMRQALGELKGQPDRPEPDS